VESKMKRRKEAAAIRTRPTTPVAVLNERVTRLEDALYELVGRASIAAEKLAPREDEAVAGAGGTSCYSDVGRSRRAQRPLGSLKGWLAQRNGAATPPR
jgi:hypothetical protein